MNKAKVWGIIKIELPKIKTFKVDNTRVRYLEELEAQKLVRTCQEPLKSMCFGSYEYRIKAQRDRTGGLVTKNIKHGTNLAQTVKTEILENANIVVNQ